MAEWSWPFRSRVKPVAASGEDWNKIYDNVEAAHDMWKRMAWIKQGRNPRGVPPSKYNDFKKEFARLTKGWNRNDERAVRRAHNLVLAIHQIKMGPKSPERIDGWRGALLKIVAKQPQGRPVGAEIRFE